jgi:hypothetical protein
MSDTQPPADDGQAWWHVTERCPNGCNVHLVSDGRFVECNVCDRFRTVRVAIEHGYDLAPCDPTPSTDEA